MQIEGVKSVVAALRAKAAKASNDANVSVAVGYTQNYALWVHENMEMSPAGSTTGSGKRAHTRVGGPKYLEGPARRLNNDGSFRTIIVTAMRVGKTLAQGLLLAGLRLQRESQQVVPVEFGALKNSAFTTLEVGIGGQHAQS